MYLLDCLPIYNRQSTRDLLEGIAADLVMHGRVNSAAADMYPLWKWKKGSDTRVDKVELRQLLHVLVQGRLCHLFCSSTILDLFGCSFYFCSESLIIRDCNVLFSRIFSFGF